MILYHGSTDIVEYPEVRKAKYNKDFYYGFYCTQYLNQAERWATRYGKKGYIKMPTKTLIDIFLDKKDEGEFINLIESLGGI